MRSAVCQVMLFKFAEFVLLCGSDECSQYAACGQLTHTRVTLLHNGIFCNFLEDNFIKHSQSIHIYSHLEIQLRHSPDLTVTQAPCPRAVQHLVCLSFNHSIFFSDYPENCPPPSFHRPKFLCGLNSFSDSDKHCFLHPETRT